MLRNLVQRAVMALPAPALRWLGRVQFKVPVIRRLGARIGAGTLSGPLTIAHGPARGMRIDVAGAHPGYGLGTSEPVLQEALVQHLRPGSVLYDLGANVGFFTLLAARLVGPTGQVVAFEPDPRNARALRGNVALNGLGNVVVVEQGVSDRVDTAAFSIGTSTTSHLARDGDVNRVDVPITSLDAFLAGDQRAPTLVKLDIEGEEVRALTGAERLLREHRPTVICEVHGTESEVRALLSGAGYAIRRLEADSADVWNAHILAQPQTPA
jgi:FkbM family methyltransferase